MAYGSRIVTVCIHADVSKLALHKVDYQLASSPHLIFFPINKMTRYKLSHQDFLHPCTIAYSSPT